MTTTIPTIQAPTVQQDRAAEAMWKVLLQRVATGKCTPILGPEMCLGAMPSCGEIARDWAAKYEYPLTDDADDLPRVAQFVAFDQDPYIPNEELCERLAAINPPNFRSVEEPHRILAELNLPVYITTTYDDFMYLALKDRKREPRRDWCRWNSNKDDPEQEPSVFAAEDGYEPNAANPVVYHLFGCAQAAGAMVLTEDKFLDFLGGVARENTSIPARIQAAFASSILFLGFCPNDLRFRVLLRSILPYLQNRKHVSVQVVTFPEVIGEAHRAKAREYLEQQYRVLDKLDIQVYWGSCRDFLVELKRRWDQYDAAR